MICIASLTSSRVNSITALPRRRLLATDLDGTFLNSSGQVSEHNRASLHRATAEGLNVVFATGRPARWLRGVADQAGHYSHIIGANGAFIADMQSLQVIQRVAVDNTAAAAVVSDVLEKFPDCTFAIERSFIGMPIAMSQPASYDEMKVSTLSDYEFAITPGYVARWSIDDIIPVAPIEELITHTDITKIIIKPADPTGWNSDTWLAALAPIVGNRLQTTHASQDVVLAELSAVGVTKAAHWPRSHKVLA